MTLGGVKCGIPDTCHLICEIYVLYFLSMVPLFKTLKNFALKCQLHLTPSPIIKNVKFFLCFTPRQGYLLLPPPPQKKKKNMNGKIWPVSLFPMQKSFAAFRRRLFQEIIVINNVTSDLQS